MFRYLAICTVCFFALATPTIADSLPRSIIQASESCDYSLSSSSATVPADGGSGAVGVSAGDGCPVAGTSFAQWLTVATKGGGLVYYSVSPNPGPARSGKILIGGLSFTVFQSAGCSLSLSSASADFEVAGGSGEITVLGSCASWTAVSHATWITVTSGTSGSGAGVVNYSVSANRSPYPRSAFIRVGGQPFTVNQPAASCPITVSRTSAIIGPLGGSETIDVSALDGCNWTAESLTPWISIAAGESGTGNGTVNFHVQENSSAVKRTGTIRIGEQSVEVTQFGLNTWYSSSPRGGDVNALAADPFNPSILYSANRAGLGFHTSTDAGLTWIRSTSAPEQAYDLALSPAAPNHIWVSSSSVYRSTDRGATWVSASPQFNPTRLAVDPQDPNTVYAGSWAGLYKTTDAGVTWTHLTGVIAAKLVLSLAVDPSDSSRVYAGTQDGLYRSTDAGTTWTVSTGGVGGVPVMAVLVNPGAAEIVYASGYTGLYRSTDRGATWSSTQVPAIGSYCLSVDPADPLIVYAAAEDVFKSTDAGESWAAVGSLPIYASQLLAVGRNTGLLLAASSWGLNRSTDDGLTWTSVSDWMSGLMAYSVAVRSDDGRALGLIYGLGLFQSANRGGSWQIVPGAPAFMDSVITQPDNPSIAYIVGNDCYKSTDGGVTWNWKSNGISTYLDAFCIGPGNTLYAGGSGGCFRSLNGGESWQAIHAGLPSPFAVNGLAVDSANPEVVYAGIVGSPADGLYRSSNQGGTWVRIAQGVIDAAVGTVLVVPGSPQRLFVGASNRLYLSANSGASWTVVWEGGDYDSVLDLTFDASDPQVMYAATYSGAFMSRDGGIHWSLLRFATSATPMEIAIDPIDPKNIYAATNRGLFAYRHGVECGASLSRTSIGMPAGEGSGTVTVTSTAGCQWAASSGDWWINVIAVAQGNGDGRVDWMIAPNNGRARTGIIVIAGLPFTIYQASGITPAGVDVFFTGPDKGLYQLRTDRYATDAAVAAVGGGTSSSHSAAIAVYRDRQYIAVKAEANQTILIKSRARGGSFAESAWTQVPGGTSSSPALCAFNDRLYLFAKGGSTAAVYYKSMDSSGVWSGWSIVSGSNTLWRPGLVVFGDRLYCFESDAAANRLWYKSMDQTETWGDWSMIATGSTNAAPTPVVQGGKIWLFAKGLAGKVLWWCSTSTPEATSSWSAWASCNGSSEAAPGLAFDPGENVFHLVVRGNMVPRMWHRTLDPATLAWSDWHLLTNLDPAAQSIDAPTVVPAAW